MISSIQFLILAAAIGTTYGQSLNVTNSAYDYVLLSQRELLFEIEIAELQNDAFDARYADRLEPIQYQQHQVLKEIHQVNQTLVPQQALSLIRKHCIQKYAKEFVAYDDAKKRIQLCYNRAVYHAPRLTANSRMYVSYARKSVVNSLPGYVITCDSYYSQNQTALESCYIDSVETTRATSSYYLRSAQVELDRSFYEAGSLSREAVQCSFEVEKEILETIGVTSYDIDGCEADLKV